MPGGVRSTAPAAGPARPLPSRTGKHGPSQHSRQLFPCLLLLLLPPPRSPLISEQKLQASRLRRTAPIFPRSALSPAGRRRGAAAPLPVHASRPAGRGGGGGGRPGKRGTP